MTDTRIVQMVVWMLGMFAIGGLCFLGVLAAMRVPLPEGLATLTGTALGALGTILTTTRTHPEQPMPVSGPGGGSDPVNVTEVGH